jgi:protein-tyrosine phosphatase
MLYHRLVPDDGHSLLYSIDSLRDQGEVVLAHCLLGSAVGTVATACDLQVSTVKDKNKVGSDLHAC